MNVLEQIPKEGQIVEILKERDKAIRFYKPLILIRALHIAQITIGNPHIGSDDIKVYPLKAVAGDEDLPPILYVVCFAGTDEEQDVIIGIEGSQLGGMNNEFDVTERLWIADLISEDNIVYQVGGE